MLVEPGNEEQKAGRLAVASVAEEKQHEENTMRDVHIGKRESETANEAPQYDSSKKLQIHRRPQPRMCLLDILRVVRNKIGRSPSSCRRHTKFLRWMLFHEMGGRESRYIKEVKVPEISGEVNGINWLRT